MLEGLTETFCEQRRGAACCARTGWPWDVYSPRSEALGAWVRSQTILEGLSMKATLQYGMMYAQVCRACGPRVVPRESLGWQQAEDCRG